MVLLAQLEEEMMKAAIQILTNQERIHTPYMLSHRPTPAESKH